MPNVLVTGGAGFLGVNAALHFAEARWAVTVLDNLSRHGSEQNLATLLAEPRDTIRFLRADVRDAGAMEDAVDGQDAILHLAAQVAVTTSIADPGTDFDINARGTLNLLEAMRRRAPQAALVYASTNKVYGALKDHHDPVDERWPLDFHSPYGCSKGAADQYVRDYARCFGLKTVVLRQSCIYGAHQYGTEDQGWVAHFVHAIVAGRPLTIYGDGHQVRDLLEVRDLCRLYALAVHQIEACQGEVFNIGGGPPNARDLLQVIQAIEETAGIPAQYAFAGWRPGDQRWYVSDVTRAGQILGWRPEIDFDDGLPDLVRWAQAARPTLLRKVG